ncbi:hypothetical protein CS210_004119, partial [Salmonella enterica subsp. enterica serovar Putten]|nr:hypothetical protein [Salmonella enterica subsp. enterica serovar Putten]
CDGPSGRGPWMGRVIRSQHISNLKYEGYRDPMIFIGSDIRFIVKGWCHSPTFLLGKIWKAVKNCHRHQAFVIALYSYFTR